MGKGRSATVVVAALACAGVTDDADAQQVRVEYSERWTTRTPGAPTGRIFTNDYFDAADPAAKPPSLSHVHFELPEGGRFDTAAIPRCTATDAQIMAEGAEACEPASRIGAGVLVADTGFAEPNRYVTTDSTFFNARDALILLAEVRPSAARVVARGVIGERTLDIDVPPLPGTPPQGGAIRHEEATIEAVTGPGGAYLTTPRECPASGAWTTQFTYTFRNGERVTREGRTPCDAATPVAAQRITFFRRQRARARRPGSLRLRSNRATDAEVEVRRGRRVVGRVRARLRAGLNRVALPAVANGRYSLVVRAGGVERAGTLVVR